MGTLVGVVTLAGGGTFVVAQAVPEGLGGWLNYGVPGLVVLAIILGWLVAGRTHDREVARADRLEAENARIHAHVTEQVIPLMTRAVLALERIDEARRGQGVA